MIDAIIVPQGAEYKAVKKGLSSIKVKQPLIITIPIGTRNISAALTNHNFWRFKPKQVLMMGLCGSLSTQYSVGDAVIYQDCYSATKATKILIDKRLNQLIIQKFNNYINQNKVSFVSSITCDRVVSTAKEKQQLARQFNVDVVDMESFDYINLLQQKKIAVSVIRIVSDDIKSDLPNLDRAIDESGKIKPLAMTKAMIEKPLASAKFIRGSIQGLQKLQQLTTKLFCD